MVNLSTALGGRSSMAGFDPHGFVLAAFERIDPSGLLAWAILDQKAEKFVTSALVGELNRERRIAEAERQRIDFVLLDDWNLRDKATVLAAYQAKCAYLSDLKAEYSDLARAMDVCGNAKPVKSAAWWLGTCLRWDVEHTKWHSAATRAGAFYLLEVEDPTKQSKYCRKQNVVTVSAALKIVENCVELGPARAATSKWSRTELGTRVRVHLALFDVPVR